MLPSVMVGDRAGMVKFCAARLAAATLKAALDIGQTEQREKDLSLAGSKGRGGNSRRRPCLLTTAAANLQELAKATIVTTSIDNFWATTTTTTGCMLLLLHCSQQ
jgi:hypothetical protein